ncbi:MAG: amino acid ABC transporter substrate-binding protein [Rhodocyclales bacterium]|nr:amino acid ABC transporter substrate-binding protein [Rhodocyclales bacterium]
MRKHLIGTLAVSAALMAAGLVQAQEIKSIKIGTAAAKTGPGAGGAGVTHWPNVKLWVAQVNKGGGILLKSAGNKRVPVELIEYDDRSSNDDAVKAIERLATQDKADFIIAPWGTGANLATAPVFAKYGYPQIAVTSVTDKGPELAKRWPNSFWLLGGGQHMAGSLVELLKKMNAEGKIGKKVAMVHVADGYGLDMVAGARPALKAAGFDVVYDKSYPLGTQDLSPIVNEIKGLNPDAFIAFSYPPDTFGFTEQSKIAGFNPKVFYVGVGGAFPVYRNKFSAATIEGVMGTGGWDVASPKIQDYIKAHKEANGGNEPDAWASSVQYAALEMLQQAIERVGALDRAAVTKELGSGEFDTVIGKLKLKGNVRENPWAVGQWQGGSFYGLSPTNLPGAHTPILKPAWK